MHLSKDVMIKLIVLSVDGRQIKMKSVSDKSVNIVMQTVFDATHLLQLKIVGLGKAFNKTFLKLFYVGAARWCSVQHGHLTAERVLGLITGSVRGFSVRGLHSSTMLVDEMWIRLIIYSKLLKGVNVRANSCSSLS